MRVGFSQVCIEEIAGSRKRLSYGFTKRDACFRPEWGDHILYAWCTFYSFILVWSFLSVTLKLTKIPLRFDNFKGFSWNDSCDKYYRLHRSGMLCDFLSTGRRGIWTLFWRYAFWAGHSLNLSPRNYLLSDFCNWNLNMNYFQQSWATNTSDNLHRMSFSGPVATTTFGSQQLSQQSMSSSLGTPTCSSFRTHFSRSRERDRSYLTSFHSASFHDFALCFHPIVSFRLLFLLVFLRSKPHKNVWWILFVFCSD